MCEYVYRMRTRLGGAWLQACERAVCAVPDMLSVGIPRRSSASRKIRGVGYSSTSAALHDKHGHTHTHICPHTRARVRCHAGSESLKTEPPQAENPKHKCFNQK